MSITMKQSPIGLAQLVECKTGYLKFASSGLTAGVFNVLGP